MNQEILISCAELRRELSNYIDEEVTPELRARIEEHIESCSHCRAIHDGVRNVLSLIGRNEIIELPAFFSNRLRLRLQGSGKLPTSDLS